MLQGPTTNIKSSNDYFAVCTSSQADEVVRIRAIYFAVKPPNLINESVKTRHRSINTSSRSINEK